LPPTYLVTILLDLLVKTYDASKVLNETLCSFDAAGIFFLGHLVFGMNLGLGEDLIFCIVSWSEC
jgi:hypothetical protein